MKCVEALYESEDVWKNHCNVLYRDVLKINSIIRILHIDDDEDFLKITKKMLEKKSGNLFQVYSITNPLNVDSLLKETHFDIILSDYAMPEMDGLSLFKNIRQYSDIPFIVFTGIDREEITLQALNLGVNNYLLKSQIIITQFFYLIRIIKDIIKFHQTEILLEEISNHFEQIFNVSNPIRIIDNNCDIIEVNNAYCSLFKVKKEYILGKKCFQIPYPKRCQYKCPINVDHKKKNPESEYEVITPKMESISSQMKVTSLYNSLGEAVGCIESFYNTSDHKETKLIADRSEQT